MKLIIITLLSLVFLLGCEQEADRIFVPTEEVWPEIRDNCETLSDFELSERSHLPKNITTNGTTIRFTNLTKNDYFNLTERVRKVTNREVNIYIYDENYYKIYNNQQHFLRCKLSSIQRLIELNEIELMNDVCIIEPRIERVQVRSHRNPIEVCWE